MLSTLNISNYALIEHLEMEFSKGLNIVTGETGAGKSIILGALSLLMGGRADTRTLRRPDKKTVVEAHFDISDFTGFEEILSDNDIDSFGDECILRREISPRGTSRAFINDTPVNLTVMKAIADKLLDIHTQNENILLSDAHYQMDIIDALAGNYELLSEYRREFTLYKAALKEYTVFRDNLQRSRAEGEYNSYLLEQLVELNLQPGEQDQLEQQRDIVANATQIKQHLFFCLEALSTGQYDALSRLAAASSELERISDFVPDSKTLAERLESARIEIADIVDTLQEYDSTITASEGELESLERRLGEIYSLEARHNVDSDAELIKIRQKLEQTLQDVENGDDTLAELEEKAKTAKKRVLAVGRRLSESRIQTASRFSEDLKNRAIPMGLDNLRCDIRVSQDRLKDTGMDTVEFLFAFNRNQSLMPVGKTASGGEKSRVILAIKSLLAQSMQLPTIIFDEVDTGVSGDIANKMAQLMLDIAARTQVIAITHIATVAAKGSTHFKVYKQDTSDSTITHVRLLDNLEREQELAIMISGDADDPTALQTARTLLGH